MIKNVKIRFNLDKENDRKAYDYLQGVEKSYSKAVISAICGFMGFIRKDGNRRCFSLKELYPLFERKSEKVILLVIFLAVLVQTPSAQTPAETEISAENEEAVLDFLDSF